MSTLAIVSLVSLLGWLFLMLGSWRSQRVSASATLRIVLIWVAVFLAVTLVFGMITG